MNKEEAMGIGYIELEHGKSGAELRFCTKLWHLLRNWIIQTTPTKLL